MDSSSRRVIAWWCLGGAVFGMIFPLAGWLWAGAGLGVGAIQTAHREQPVMNIVATAPLVLAIAGGIVGVFHARFLTAYRNCERNVRLRTAELEAANNHLVELMRAKDHFVSTVGHEVRSPLTAVQGFASHLLDMWSEVDEEQAMEMIEVIAGQAAEVTDILDDLLIASRAELDSLSIESREIDLEELTGDCLAMLCLTRDIEGRIESAVRPSRVVGDPGRIRQIVRNLVTNAERYGGSRIRVSTGSDHEGGYVCIADNGSGVPSDDVERIFEPYTHSDDTATVSGSVGIGLSVSRTLARLMGGDVVYQRANGWTEFVLRLPPAGVDSSACRPLARQSA